jgi:hypothetical protein
MPNPTGDIDAARAAGVPLLPGTRSCPVAARSRSARSTARWPGGVVYGMQGFRIWLWIATAMAIVMLLVAATVLRERRGQVIQEFTIDAEPAVEVVAAAVGSAAAPAAEPAEETSAG